MRIHAYIYGKVQGVFFRASTKEVADKLGVSGWVKNLPDGRVEVVAEGRDLSEFIKWLHKGPPGAVVEKVEIVYEKEEGLKGFTISFS